MRVSEILLRLGCNLVGWLIIYSHCIWLGVIPRVACGAEGEELYRLSLGFSPVAFGAAFLLAPANNLTAVVAYLKWMALPLLLLIPLTIRPILAALETTTLGGVSLCETGAVTDWQRAWAPLQIVTLLVIVYAAVKFVAKPTQSGH